ncbi:type II secretion system GspH family protein [Massilia sp. P8910]|uniref:type II secretion system protein n=1 Tax=Massilia antarctica TaxID=2765360 RepID=UPI001E645454|nr:type II secretion system protein [Massilia antarctica]MCE3603620.1 type II secretion system GspH family protein [Massilia antarctica]
MKKGFTIVELLVTIVIVSILATAAMPMAELAIRRSKEQELRRGLLQIREALDAYKQASDQGHIPVKSGSAGFPPNLEALVEGVDDAKNPSSGKIFFLRRIPRDPFAQGAMPAAATWGKRSYISTADDPKEGSDVYDVYSMAAGQGLNGTLYREW